MRPLAYPPMIGEMVPERDTLPSAPAWLRKLGFSSWLIVGFVLVILGVIWLLGQTSTIVMPVILAAVLGAVAGPAVGWLERHRVPRVGGAILVLLGLVAISVFICLLVFAGISDQSASISAKLNQALDKIQGWFSDLGANQTDQAKTDVQNIRGTDRGAVYFELFFAEVRDRVLASGLVDPATFDAAAALLKDPEYWTQCWMMTAVWARKPVG